jgi:hypothetical protein
MGAGMWEPTTLSPKGIRNAMTTWRLKKIMRRRRGEATVIDAWGGSGHFLTLRDNNGHNVAVRKTPDRSTIASMLQILPPKATGLGESSYRKRCN